MARESSMADKREYIRVSVSLPMNPKLGMIDDPAVSWLYVVSLCHCGEYLTDGVFIPAIVARAAGVPMDLGKRLVSAGMWHEPGHECARCQQPPEGHLVVHDYLMHQRSKAQADQVRTVRQAAANSRWSKRDASRMQVASDVQSNGHPTSTPDANGMQVASPMQCKGDAEEEVEEEGEQTSDSPSVGGSGGDASQQAAPPKRESKRGARITKDWTPSQEKRESLTARFQRPSQWWLDETDKFVNWFVQKTGRDATSLDWDARFDVWIREAVRREGGSGPPSGQANGKRHQSEGYHNGIALARRLHEEEQAAEVAALNGQLAMEGPKR